MSSKGLYNQLHKAIRVAEKVNRQYDKEFAPKPGQIIEPLTEAQILQRRIDDALAVLMGEKIAIDPEDI